MSHDLLAALERIVGRAGLSGDAASLEPWLTDHRRLYQGRALALVEPASTDEVAAVLAACNAARTAVVPQGGNTSYCGGATPDASGSQILLSLRRLDRIRSVDPANDSMICEAGCILADAQRAAAEAGRLLPLSLGSEGSCRIGGNLSTNAGGTTVLRYGMMRDLVLGLEVVLADGRVLADLRILRKDNTGYDLKSLFLGAEGTLGVITAAALRLHPAERSTATALIAVRDPVAAVALLQQMRSAAGEVLSAFELIPRIGIELTTRHVPGIVDPLPGEHEWFVLCELGSARADAPLPELLEEVLAPGLGTGEVRDAVLARSERERAALWRLRESIPEGQRREGLSLKHDVAVPVSALPGFLAEASTWVATHVPEARLVAYGHVGDGNLHFNVSQRPGADPAALLAREAPLRRAVHDLADRHGGTFSAEHGIGQLKVGELERYGDPVALALMRDLKRTLDPNGILNPGKVLRA